MVYIGITDLLFALCHIFTGLMHILRYDLWNLAWFWTLVGAECFKMEACLSFVLALNRLRIMCEINYPAFLHKVSLDNLSLSDQFHRTGAYLFNCLARPDNINSSTYTILRSDRFPKPISAYS
ncbi:hypothetical protein L596_026534 [Steinernema carpocapsae]|uniref:G-protein coupled receptors family 1 profile domain-containing protein n=1 Tax=Steinernema carpocapsae TaxID=34508 RepID=A0A4U5M1N6_STECR|nr:hypothetical protein L596_026534 [Steinernema carpocapsae]